MFYKFFFPKQIITKSYTPPIFSFSYSEISKDEPSYSHIHPYTEILIPFTSAGYLMYNQDKLPMKKGEIYIIPPNITHTESNTTSNSIAKYCVVKTYNDINYRLPSETIVKINVSENCNELLFYLLNASNSLINNNDELYITLNLMIFYRLFETIATQKGLYFNTNSLNMFSEQTKEIELYISNNYMQDLKIEDIADKFAISHNTLIHKFKKNIGVSPKEFLINRRIEEAKDMILTSNYTLTQISTSCGFISPAYFTYVFKKIVKMTPKEFRNKNTKNKQD